MLLATIEVVQGVRVCDHQHRFSAPIVKTVSAPLKTKFVIGLCNVMLVYIVLVQGGLLCLAAL